MAPQSITVVWFDDSVVPAMGLSDMDVEVEFDQSLLTLGPVEVPAALFGAGANVFQTGFGLSTTFPGQTNPIFTITRTDQNVVPAALFPTDVAYFTFTANALPAVGTSPVVFYPVPSSIPALPGVPRYYRFSPNNLDGVSSFNITVVPEPASIALMLAGLAAVGAVVRRRRSGSMTRG